LRNLPQHNWSVLFTSVSVEEGQEVYVWWDMLIITVLERLRQEDFEFENSLCYIKSSRPAWATERDLVSKQNSWAPVAHTYNPSFLGEAEIRRIEVQSQPRK
jgi:Sec7-like guanine-nucleotide exchange factor